MKTVRLGEVIKVDNKIKKNGANSEYYYVMVRGGRGTYKMLLTTAEMGIAIDRAIKNPEDTYERSFASKILD